MARRPVVTKRSRRLHMLLSADESSILEALVRERGLTTSDVVRQLIRAARPARGSVPR